MKYITLITIKVNSVDSGYSEKKTTHLDKTLRKKYTQKGVDWMLELCLSVLVFALITTKNVTNSS